MKECKRGMANNHALIFGATGIQGWAVTSQLLADYPTKDSFSRITAVTNRPITQEMLWPASEKLSIIEGIDILSERGLEGLIKDLQTRAPNIQDVTHVFFFAYIYKEDPSEEIAINVELLKRCVKAVASLSPGLKFVLLPTGTKVYGVQCLADFPFADKLPLTEELPRIPEPHRSQNFYYNQTDWLMEEGKGKAWTFCEIRPDVVVGFVPNKNVYCLAQTLATYLSCYREIEGEGAECAFPGTAKSWKSLANDSDQDTVARFAIHASLHAEICGLGRAFNVASHSTPTSWEQKWPVICDFFQLNGTPPSEDGSGPQPDAYLASHLEKWKELEKKHGLVTGRVGNDRSLGGFQHFIMTLFDFDRQLDLSNMHRAWGQGGEVEEKETREVWWTAFQRFRAAKIIP